MRIVPQEQADYIRKLIKTLPPFTITITDPEDGSEIVSAFMFTLAGNREGAELLSIALAISIKALGTEEGVDAWLGALKDSDKTKARTGRLPKFFRPLLIHYFSHIKSEHEKQ